MTCLWPGALLLVAKPLADWYEAFFAHCWGGGGVVGDGGGVEGSDGATVVLEVVVPCPVARDAMAEVEEAALDVLVPGCLCQTLIESW